MDKTRQDAAGEADPRREIYAWPASVAVPGPRGVRRRNSSAGASAADRLAITLNEDDDTASQQTSRTRALTGDETGEDEDFYDEDDDGGVHMPSRTVFGSNATLANSFAARDDATQWSSDRCWEQVKVNQYDGEIPSQRSLHIAVGYHQSMYIFGGYNGRHRVNALHRFDFLSATWHAMDTAGGEPPSPRDRHTGVVVEDALLIFGGYDGMVRCNDIHAFDLRHNSWVPVELTSKVVPSARHSHAACSLGDKMYVTCGYDGSYRNDLYEFTLASMSDEGENTMLRRRTGESDLEDETEENNTALAPYGSAASTVAANEPCVRGQWRKIMAKGRFPQARYRATCCVHADAQSSPKIVLFGGHNGLVHLQCTHVFDIVSETWSTVRTVGAVPLPRDSHCAVMYEDNMLVFGGSCGQPLNDFSCLSMRTLEWRPVGGDSWTPSARFCASAVLHDRSFYIFGGYDSTERLRDIHRFKFAASVYSVERSTILEDFSESVGDDFLSDMVFVLGGTYIPAHRIFCTRCTNILASTPAESAVEEAGSESSPMECWQDGANGESQAKASSAPERDGSGRYVIRVRENVKLDIFRSFLRYLYTDKVQLVDAEMALEMYTIAEEYQVERLQKICLNFISITLTVQNAANVFQASDLHKIRKLRDRTLKFILHNFDAVSKTKAFEEMGRINVELVFEVLRNRGDEGRETTPEDAFSEDFIRMSTADQLSFVSGSAVSSPRDSTMGGGTSAAGREDGSFAVHSAAVEGQENHGAAEPLVASYYERARQWIPVSVIDDGVSPGKRSLHAMTVYKDTILLFGGYNGRERVNDFYQFSLKTHKWEIVPVLEGSSPPPSPRDRHTIMQLGHCLWVFGGYDGQVRVNELHSFDLQRKQWSIINKDLSAPTARHSHSGCAVPSRKCLYIFGGYDGSYLNDLHEFDVMDYTWRCVKTNGTPPTPRYRATLVCMGHHLVCAMGHDGYRHLNDLHSFNLRTNTWAMLRLSGPAPAPRDSHTACTLGSNHMIIFGGSSGSSLNCMHRLRFSKDEGVWSRVTCNGMLPSPRFCHSSVLIGKTMYTYGGYDGSNRLEDWIEFSFGENRVSQVPRSAIVSDLASLVDNPKCSDVSFLVEGRRIAAHRIVCVRCDYFKAMFAREGGFRESRQQEITILDVRYDTFYTLLRYLYTDRQDVPLEMAMDLFIAADRFGIERLKNICENGMLSSLDMENVSELFAAADLHHAAGLHSECLRFIVQNFDIVSKTRGFEEMGRSNIDLIFTILKNR
ncbi:Kelch domain-containing protein 3 [Hondaea fermentalgiana]|uniref:Kelch domain-containing protein 3 n=1 Tax=Hondaea fermentalgiana TaxID=2315210 RepID=A0A2R5GPF9_9STRA|nr:Kelch domain-containing protein 3 [Hondaea fermentalgiana]|eukprot:GBG32762.1 Kelch domain-containing protein 3 [Hondaea fermentalgiana]